MSCGHATVYLAIFTPCVRLETFNDMAIFHRLKKNMKGCSLKEEPRRHWRKPIPSSQVLIFVNVKSMNLAKVVFMDFPSPISCYGGELCLQTFPLRNILLVCCPLLLLHREGRSGANVISKAKFIPEVNHIAASGVIQFNPSL